MAGTKKKYFDAERFAAGFRQILSAFPTEADKRELDVAFRTLIQFLSDIRERLATVPSKEQTEGMHAAIRTLQEAAERAKSSPFLAAAIGTRPPRPARARATSISGEDKARAKTLLQQLELLPIDQMRGRLADESTNTLRDLQVLGSLIGIKANQRIGRDTLIHQITTRIANYRGYEQLRGRSEERT